MTLDEATCKICPFTLGNVESSNCTGSNCMAWVDTSAEPSLTEESKQERFDMLNKQKKLVSEMLKGRYSHIDLHNDPFGMATSEEEIENAMRQVEEKYPMPDKVYEPVISIGYCARLGDN